MKRAELLKDVIELIQRQKEIELIENDLLEEMSWNNRRDLEDDLKREKESLENWLNEEV